MSELGIQSWSMLAADLGPKNPFSPLDSRQKPRFEDFSSIPEVILGNKSWGPVASILPCTIRNGCTRLLHPTELTVSIRSTGRLRLLEAQVSLSKGDFAAGSIFHREIVIPVDLREWENSLTDLWFEYHTRRIKLENPAPFTSDLKARIRQQYLPAELDFSLIPGDKPGE